VKTTGLVFLAFALALQSRADDFLRALPDAKFSAQLIADKFKNADAVIILKEQSLAINATGFMYRGYDLSGLAMTRTTILMTKVFNQAGISRFGSFEYEYPERFGNEIKAGFVCRARVQKPDGEIVTMPESDVHILVSEESSDGDPIARKAVFKIPNLAAGDVVQIEYTLTEPLARAMSGIFYYNDRVPVLFSNLMITLPQDDEIKVYGFPADRIGEPKTSQVSKSYGAGLTYFWNLKSLNAIPQEPYTYTFDDLSFLTAFVVNPRLENGFLRITDWDFIGNEYVRDYIDEGSVKHKRVAELGFGGDKPALSMQLTDSLYTALRRSIALKRSNSLYPLSEDIESVFTTKRGDASDLAYIFYKILRDWKTDARVAWIRDKRQGMYEPSVPSIRWFDRIGVLVRVGNDEKMYDFDRSVPAHYVVPSFLKSISVPLLTGKMCEHRTLSASPGPGSYILDSHDLVFRGTQELEDSLVYACNGTPAEEFRSAVYELRGTELRNHCRTLATGRCLVEADTVVSSAFLDDPEIRLTFKGRSKASVAAVDTFLTVKLTNEALRGFREQVFSAVRYNDFVMIDPLAVSVTWRLHVPHGYVLRSVPSDTTIRTVQGLAAILKCSRVDDGVRVQADLRFSENVIPAENFPRLIKTFDGLLACCEQAIVLARK
jgi:hypothetical protein